MTHWSHILLAALKGDIVKAIYYHAWDKGRIVNFMAFWILGLCPDSTFLYALLVKCIQK